MKLYFAPQPFYNSSYENALPEDLQKVQDHFKQFYAEYQERGQELDTLYTQSNENTMNFFSCKPIKHKTIDSSLYWSKHAEYQTLKKYYGFILNACRIKFDFWLNDLLPKQNNKNKKKQHEPDNNNPGSSNKGRIYKGKYYQ